MTLNGVIAVNLRYSAEFGSFGPITSKWLKVDPHSQKYSPKKLILAINDLWQLPKTSTLTKSILL